jgi:hypothetical protein
MFFAVLSYLFLLHKFKSRIFPYSTTFPTHDHVKRWITSDEIIDDIMSKISFEDSHVFNPRMFSINDHTMELIMEIENVNTRQNIFVSYLNHCNEFLTPKTTSSYMLKLLRTIGNKKYCRKIHHMSVFQFILDKLKSNNDKVDGDLVLKSMYSLRYADPLNPITGELLRILHLKLLSSYGIISSQAIGMAVYGLQNFTLELPISTSGHESDLHIKYRNEYSSILTKMLSTLTIIIKNCKEDFDSQAIGNSFYGLKNMRGDVKEVRDLLAALAPKVYHCPESLNAQTIGIRHLYSFRN